MNEIITPLQFLITTVAWGVNEWQAKRIEFLCREIEVYRRLVGTGRLKLTNNERRELAGYHWRQGEPAVFSSRPDRCLERRATRSGMALDVTR